MEKEPSLSQLTKEKVGLAIVVASKDGFNTPAPVMASRKAILKGV